MKIYIYNCKDNRTRAIIKNDDGSTRTVSCPRILMERSWAGHWSHMKYIIW